jgi:fatty acid-binding protein DegV
LHSDALGQTQALMQEVREILPDGKVWIEQINPVLGAHIGPGVVGFACVSKA